MPQKFSLGSFIAALEEGYEPQASRNFTAKDIRDIAAQACEAFRSSYMDLLSCFRLEGPLELWAALENFVTASPVSDAVTKAIQDGQEGALLQAFKRSMQTAFTTLYNKGALRRLQLVDELPPEALRDLRVLLTTVAPPRPAPAPVVPAAPVETLEDTCVREFKELSSAAWKMKWLSNQHNRVIADRCAAEGRL